MQDYKTIRSIADIDAYIGNAGIISFDFETAATDQYRQEEWSALDAHKSYIVGISVSVEAGTGRYIPLRHRVGQNAEVWVNGKYCGIRISQPYLFDITDAVNHGENAVAVVVSNTLGQKFRDGFSKFLQLSPSGLLGGVRVRFKL